MILSSSTQAIGRNSQDFLELEEENLRDSHLIKCHEESYRPARTLSKDAGGAHGTPTVQPTEVQRAPGRIEERSRESFLRFREEWVKNRARDIQRAGSISFNVCSEDTASITARNEFYRWRVFDGFMAGHRDEKGLEIGMTQDSRDFGSFRKDAASAEKLHMCRMVCIEKGRPVFRKTCRRRAES